MNHTVFDITGDSSESVQLFTLLKPHTEIWVIIKLARLVMVAEVGLVGKNKPNVFKMGRRFVLQKVVRVLLLSILTEIYSLVTRTNKQF